jgi:hypothetical protein
MQLLDGYQHLQGVHCGTTALNNIAHFHGQPLTEPLCLGIGEGLGFVVVTIPAGTPSRLIMGRSRDLEKRFFENLGISFEWQVEDGRERAWQAAREMIDHNVPVMLRTDLHFLPYYHSKTHFTGHTVVLAGYNAEQKKALLSDTDFESLQEVTLNDLARARTSDHGFSPLRNHAFPVERYELPGDLGKIFRRVIVSQAKTLLEGQDRGISIFGVKGMEHLATTFPDWAKADDWKWCARYAYQMIEKRGTGGGNFRRLYATFLSDVDERLQALDLAPYAARMLEIAECWTQLANHLKAISESDSPEGFDEAGRIMADITERERSFYTDALTLA